MKRVLMFVFPIVMIIGMVVSAFAIVTALQSAPTGTNQATVAQAVDPVAHGEQLFVSKGCIVCHVNNRVTGIRDSGMLFSDVPNLTTVKVDRDYLRRWLHDPAAMKPGTEMPNLNLSDAEIEALTAFLTADNQ